MPTVRSALLFMVALVLAACGPALAESDDANDTALPPSTTPATTTLPQMSDTVSVPDLKGMTLANARALLHETRLEIRALPEDIDEAIVAAQEPAAGAETNAGTLITVDVHVVPTCNPPDPVAPGPGQVIITVLYECGGEAIAPTPGIGVPRIVPESNQMNDRIEWTLRSLLAGPTPDEQAVGFDSFFDEETAGALHSVTFTNGELVVDFNDAIIVNNMNTSTGMVFFNAELKRNVFQYPEVESVEFRFNGDCAAWSALFESDGCWIISRADWDADLADWEQARPSD